MNLSLPGPTRPWVIRGAVVGLGTPVLTYAFVLVAMGAESQAAVEFYPLLLLVAVFSGLILSAATVPLGIAAALAWWFVAARLPKSGLLGNRALLAAYFGAVSGIATQIGTGQEGPALLATIAASLTSALWTVRRKTLSEASDAVVARSLGYTRGRIVGSWILRGLVVAAVIGVIGVVPDFAAALLLGGPVVLYPMVVVSFVKLAPLAAAFSGAGGIFGWLLTLDDRPVVRVPVISAIYFGLVAVAVTSIFGLSVAGGGATAGLVGFAIGWVVATRSPARIADRAPDSRFEGDG